MLVGVRIKNNCHVLMILMICQILICILMIGTSAFLVMRIEQLAEAIDEETSTPSDFTVFVRNLPKDVSEGALVAHFSMRFTILFLSYN